MTHLKDLGNQKETKLQISRRQEIMTGAKISEIKIKRKSIKEQ